MMKSIITEFESNEHKYTLNTKINKYMNINATLWNGKNTTRTYYLPLHRLAWSDIYLRWWVFCKLRNGDPVKCELRHDYPPPLVSAVEYKYYARFEMHVVENVVIPQYLASEQVEIESNLK